MHQTGVGHGFEMPTTTPMISQGLLAKSTLLIPDLIQSSLPLNPRVNSNLYMWTSPSTPSSELSLDTSGRR